MKTQYKIKDGNLTYDVKESVRELILALDENGELTLAKVTRRRYFSISDTLVKEDSQPSQSVDLQVVKTEALAPTALSIQQISTALLLRLLQALPDYTGVEGLILPTLPGDIGASVDEARKLLTSLQVQVEEAQVKVTEGQTDLAAVQERIKFAGIELENIESKIKEFATNADSAKISLDAELQEMQARRISLTTTIDALEQAIKAKSEESTILQSKVAALQTKVQEGVVQS